MYLFHQVSKQKAPIRLRVSVSSGSTYQSFTPRLLCVNYDANFSWRAKYFRHFFLGSTISRFCFSHFFVTSFAFVTHNAMVAWYIMLPRIPLNLSFAEWNWHHSPECVNNSLSQFLPFSSTQLNHRNNNIAQKKGFMSAKHSKLLSCNRSWNAWEGTHRLPSHTHSASAL